MSDMENRQPSLKVKESSIPQQSIASEVDAIAQRLPPLAQSMMEHVANASHPMAEAAQIMNDIKSQLYSMNTALKLVKPVARVAVKATKQSQAWSLAAVVAAKISVTVMLFVFIFLGFLLF